MRTYKDRKKEVHLDPTLGPQGIMGRRNIAIFVHDGPNSLKEKTKHGPQLMTVIPCSLSKKNTTVYTYLPSSLSKKENTVKLL
jgi:hypothetical protein